MSDKTQRGLFTLLESSYQQQQVTLLVHQSFPEALSSQVAFIVTLKLALAGYVVDRPIFGFRGDLGELILCAAQLSLQAGEFVLEGGPLLAQ